jgi:ABC-2 type transport system ATP-binding protein
MIAAFALARPLVVVDEATAALDPEAVVVLRDVLRALAERGAGVLVATQDLGFAERICDEVVLLSNGRTAAAGTLAEITGGLSLEQAFLSAVGAQARIHEARRELVAL